MQDLLIEQIKDFVLRMNVKKEKDTEMKLTVFDYF